MKDLFASKKFRASLLAIAGMIAAKFGYPEAKIDELITLVSPLLAFIVGQGIADAGGGSNRERKEGEA